MDVRKISSVLIALAVLLAACDSSEKEDLRTTQRNSIEKYLTSSRRIIPREQVGTVIEENPKFYETSDDRVYRHIVTFYEPGRINNAEIEEGDTVELMFEAYVFNGGEPNYFTDLYWSNIEDVIEFLKEIRSVNPAKIDWSTDPLKITVGETKMIKGLDLALRGCRDKDSVQIYMTYNLGYGGSEVGQVPPKSSLAWYFKILSVSK